MPRAGPPASRRSSRSAKACGAASALSPKRSRAVSPCATITGRNTCPTPSRRSLPSSASRARPPSCGPPRGMRGEWLCRALHPHAQGELALGVPFRHRRGAPSGAARLSGGLQHKLADRTARVPDARHRPAEPAFTRGSGRVRLNPVSHNLGAVHYLPRQCFQPLVDEGKLEIVPTDPALPAVPYVVMYRGDRLSPFISTVAELVYHVCDFSQHLQW